MRYLWRAVVAVWLGMGLLVRPVAAAAPVEPVAPPQQTAPGYEYIGETGHLIGNGFLAMWQQGGASVFGYPLTEEFSDACTGGPCVVQYFERARFEYDLATGRVSLGLLGREYLAGRVFAPEAPFPSGPDRWYLPETGQALGFGFLDYWLQHDGPRLIGFPISPEVTEDGRTVQYFERGRLEYWPEHGPEHSIVVAPLGRAIVERRGWSLPAIVDVALSDASVAQGRPLALAVRGARSVDARWAGEPMPVFQSDGVWRGVIGIAPWAETGRRTLTLEIIAADGTPRRLTRDVPVTPFDFPRERFIVPEGQEELVDPETLRRELAIVEPLYEIVTPAPRWQGSWQWPVQGPITTQFATRRAYNDGPFDSYHGGLDIGAPLGTSVVAPAPGRVVYAGRLAIRGNFIAIDHGLGLLSTYFHLNSLNVSAGDEVEPGQVIGRVGSTGLSSGPHLHWEARIRGVPVEPRTWLAADLLP